MRRQQSAGEIVRLVEDSRQEAARISCMVWPRNAKAVARVPGLHPSSIARARNAAENGDTTSPPYRAALWLVGLRTAGFGPEQGQLLIDWLQEFHLRLYAAGGQDPVAALLAEQETDGPEDVSQVRYLATRNRHTRQTWLRDARAQRARLSAAIAAVQAEDDADVAMEDAA